MITCACSIQVCLLTLHSGSDQSGPSPGTEYFLHMSFFNNMFQIIPHCWRTFMVFTIVLKLNSDRRHCIKVLKQEWCHSTHKKDTNLMTHWQVMRSKSREVFYSVRSCKTHKMDICGFTLNTTSCILHTRKMTGGAYLGEKKQKKLQKADFKKKFLHEAFRFSDGSICKQPKQFSVHYVFLSRQFEFNLPAREMLFAHLSVIIAVLPCLPVCLCVRDRESVL